MRVFLVSLLEMVLILFMVSCSGQSNVADSRQSEIITTTNIQETAGVTESMTETTTIKEKEKVELREVPLVIRDDGFSLFFTMEPAIINKDNFLAQTVDFLKFAKPVIKEFGLGPGSVFTFDTKVGEKFGDGLTEKQKAMLRKGDNNVIENINKLIAAGHEPLKIVTDRCHELGKKTWARLEMNHEYGPPSEDNWSWVAFVGSLNKQHPEYRIGNTVFLDFKFPEVREFKFKILEEVAQRGIDGLSLDFCVDPPFLSDPMNDAHFITEFIRDVRSMLDRVGGEKHIDLIVRVPYDGENLGLEWEKWMEEGLIDVIIPSVVSVPDKFHIPVERFVEKAKDYPCLVYGCIRPIFGYVTTDESPGDREKKIVRTEKPVPKEVFFAKALLLIRSGVDGIQVALGSGTQGEWPLFYNFLGSEERLMYSDKEYYADRKGQLPLILTSEENSEEIKMMIADDIGVNDDEGPEYEMTFTLYGRGLEEGETLDIIINEKEMLRLTDKDFQASVDDEPIVNPGSDPNKLFATKNWWELGENTFAISNDLFQRGSNTIRFEYGNNGESEKKSYTISDLYIKICYKR